ncbi:hypothetical protein [Runella slithyformis]|uniref:Uncharacterized protein n=1 Tax=Runella slithyformis (strain ATCC 29530 / DSM 19594 / LMG 11500 / NCIMB 11436 / LSU 4) TaxID=761193 RepID=A0A7U4E663_RUNSL|nr:hypothetical protein [Runella slithyformis]AEI48869.1 hypothetical protein Runsl_2464 [Runella slithyformis DSM 19594]
MKTENNTITLLSNIELFDISGGQDPNKPHGIFQWLGYAYEWTKEAYANPSQSSQAGYGRYAGSYNFQ